MYQQCKTLYQKDPVNMHTEVDQPLTVASKSNKLLIVFKSAFRMIVLERYRECRMIFAKE